MTQTNDVAPAVVDHFISPRGRLAIHLAAAEIRLSGTDGDRVTVRTPNGRPLPDRIVVKTADDGVTIRETEPGGLVFAIGRRVVQLEIEVPVRAEIAIETTSGWLDAIGLTGEQRYRTISSDTRLREAAGQIQLNTVSGDATIELAAAAELGVKSVSGDIAVLGGRLDAVRIGTTSGDVRIGSPLVGRSDNTIETLSGDVSVVAANGLRVEARTVSGDLTSDLPHRSEGRMGRRTIIVGDGSIELRFRSVSGDLRIQPVATAGRPVGTARGPASGPVTGSAGLPDAPAADAPDDATEAERMAILRALEQGELDVPTAMDRLAALDAANRGEDHVDA